MTYTTFIHSRSSCQHFCYTQFPPLAPYMINKEQAYSKHYSQWWKTESIPPKIRNKTRVSTFTTIIQHSSRSPSYSYQRRKINKRNLDRKQRRQWHPTPVLLPGKSHGQRSLVGYSPWGRKSWTRLSDFHYCYNTIINGLYYVEAGSFYAHFLKSFNHKWGCILSKAFSTSIEIIIWL